MKYLYLLRHAKSDWDTPFTNDHERGLAPRGIKSIQLLRKFIRFKKIKIDFAYISNAKRTVQTYSYLTKNFNFVNNIKVIHELYDTTPKTYFELLNSLSDDQESLLFVGHNPEMEQVANLLLGNTSSNSLFHKFPTCSFLGVSLKENSWKAIKQPCNGNLIFFFNPSKGNLE